MMTTKKQIFLSYGSGTINNIGVVYKSIGEMQKALDYYQQALAIRVSDDQEEMLVQIVKDELGE